MAGKGRGIAAFTFNIEALGITRGSMPETQRGPQPLYPVSPSQKSALKVLVYCALPVSWCSSVQICASPGLLDHFNDYMGLWPHRVMYHGALLTFLPCVQQHMEFKPVPLKAGEDEDYMLALKQEIRGRMKGLPFHIKPCLDRSGGLCSCRITSQ